VYFSCFILLFLGYHVMVNKVVYIGDAIGSARRRLKHKNSTALWLRELSCVRLNRECQFHAKSHELNQLIGAFWLVLLTEHKVLPLYTERSLSLPGWRAIVPVVRIFFQLTISMLPTFQLLSGNSLNSLCAPHPLTGRYFKNQNHMFLWNFHDFIYFLLIFSCVKLASLENKTICRWSIVSVISMPNIL